MPHPPLIIAHRGASADAPENTMRAFELAARQGAQMIELDVRASSDGEVVVFHDPTTERWDGRATEVRLLPWSSLRHVDLRGERIPRLPEVCDWARTQGMALNVEIKVPGCEQAVARILAATQTEAQVIVSSFNAGILQTLRAIAPQVRRCILMGTRTRRLAIRAREAFPLFSLRRLDAYAWHPAYQLPLLPRITATVQRCGYRVHVWTVDDPRVLRRMIGLGVNGIITNRPAVLREILASSSGGSTTATALVE